MASLGPGPAGAGGNGGAAQGAGIYVAAGTLTIGYSTIAGNAAAASVGGNAGVGTGAVQGTPLPGQGGGLYVAASAPAPILQDTIVATNTDTAGTPDISGTVASTGHNLIGNSAGAGGLTGTDLTNVNPDLGLL